MRTLAELESGPEQHLRIFEIYYDQRSGEEGQDELLQWFSELPKSPPGKNLPGNEDISGQSSLLVFPSSMSKTQRACWHRLSSNYSLSSLSKGLERDRHLVISREEGKPKRADQLSKAGAELGDKAAEEEALQLYKWCMDEGGGYLKYSRGELLQIFTDGRDLSPDLLELSIRRNKAKQAIALLMQDDEERAISILNTERSLAWVRDDTSGAYPLHIAAWRGLEGVVANIIEQPSTMQQRDRQRKTPLQIARQRRQTRVADMLKAAGAPDYS